MMQGLEKIASLLKLYKLRVSLYADNQPNEASARNLSFENAVIKVYIHILEFQACVVSHLWKGSFRQVARNTVKADDWQSKLNDIETADAECLLFTNLLDKEKDERTREHQCMHLEQQTKLQQGIVEALDTTRKDREADYDVEQKNKLMHSFSTDYVDQKNFNPKRVPGTCEWFLQSKEFLEWRNATDLRILWVSAGPGCGKSVLSRCLIDERHVFHRARASIICYFFFRDGQAERETGPNALKAFLHQLLKQHPSSNLIRYLLPRFEAHGDKLGGMFSELWDSVLEILSDPTTSEVVWVLDALDECTTSERERLLECLTEIYSSEEYQNNKNMKLKTLITSRQYHDIEVRFRRLKGMAGYIQLDGDEKSEEISREINLVIEYSVPRVAPSLRKNDQAKVIEHLRSTPHRTYLWLHLMLKEIEHKVVAFGTERRIASIIKKLPISVYEAYERILERSADQESARKILQIVIAAKRALTVPEMNVALALALQGRCYSYDALDRPSDQEFKLSVKQICGLFVNIVDQKVYLLHQTAREFLLCQPELASQGWQHSLSLESGHSLLFRICVLLLCFSEFEFPPWDLDSLVADIPHSLKYHMRFDPWIDGHALLRYAAGAWVDHSHQMQENSDYDLIEAGLELCNPSLKKFVTWWRIYAPHTFPPSEHLHVVCKIGWHAAVKRMLIDGLDVNLRTHGSKECPLHMAACSDQNYAVVKLLLDRGADSNAKNSRRRRPLHSACLYNARRVAEILLDSGANIDATGSSGTGLWLVDAGTGLWVACKKDNVEMVQFLLRRGAKVNLGDSRNGNTHFPLVKACENGNITIVQNLINHEADINVVDHFYRTARTALTAACIRGHEAIVRLLLQNGADIKAAGGIALTAACLRGYEAIVRLLLQNGADTEADTVVPIRSFSGREWKITPLHFAAWSNCPGVAQLLIDYGADVNTQPDKTGIPLLLAAHKGNYSMVKFLLENGADVLATCDYFVNAFVAAAEGKHREIMQLLLSHGARFCKSDWRDLRDWDSEGYLLNLDSIYEQVKDKDMQETIQVLLEAKGLVSNEADKILRHFGMGNII